MDIESVKNIYLHMADEISRKIFVARLNASITFDDSYIINLSNEFKVLNDEIITFRNKLVEDTKFRTVVFGAGFNGQYFVKQLLGGNAFAFIDNYSNKKFDKTNGLPIYRLQEYVECFGIENTRFVISVSNRNAANQMFKQLINNKIAPDKIVIAPEDYRNNLAQYFDVFTPNGYETFVDCGAYDGSTAVRFVDWCGNYEYNKIWCFEPDTASFESVKINCSKLHDCFMFPYGVSECQKEVSFVSNGSENARIEEVPDASTNIIKTVKLDDVLYNEKITFIKMDIEGEEYKALKGAKTIITEQKPKLAISVYHRNDDIFNIPNLLLKLVPEYKFFIRHYSLLTNETILYAY